MMQRGVTGTGIRRWVAWWGLGLVLMGTMACTQRRSGAQTVPVDAFLAWSDWTKYATPPSSQGTDAPSLLDRAVWSLLTRLAAAAPDRVGPLPRMLSVTCLVQDRTGRVVGSHVLMLGHNRWDQTVTGPTTLAVRIHTPLLTHAWLVRRIDPHDASPVHLNILAELVHAMVADVDHAVRTMGIGPTAPDHA